MNLFKETKITKRSKTSSVERFLMRKKFLYTLRIFLSSSYRFEIQSSVNVGSTDIHRLIKSTIFTLRPFMLFTWFFTRVHHQSLPNILVCHRIKNQRQLLDNTTCRPRPYVSLSSREDNPYTTKILVRFPTKLTRPTIFCRVTLPSLVRYLPRTLTPLVP